MTNTIRKHLNPLPIGLLIPRHTTFTYCKIEEKEENKANETTKSEPEI